MELSSGGLGKIDQGPLLGVAPALKPAEEEQAACLALAP